MRIAVAGFMHESNTFVPMITDRQAFVDQCLAFDDSWPARWKEAHHEVGGFLEGVEKLGAELIPVCMAWATPSGPVADAVHDEVVGAIIERVRQSKPDGLLLALHGAMVTQSDLDGDGKTVTKLREALGPNLPIVVTLDLHGNISDRLVANSTAAIAYRTCPHVDQRARGLQAAELMGRIVRKEVRPVQALSKPPVLVNIMVHDTSQAPLRVILDEARRIEAKPGILGVSMLPGFAYADVPQMGPALIVVADGDQDLARREADALGQFLWARRKELVRELPSPEEAVRQAMASNQTPVVLVETGDNVGGGSAGDGTFVLAEMLRQKATDGVVCLYAPDEVQQCLRAGLGAQVKLHVGGKVDRLHGDPVDVVGKVRVLHDGDYLEPLARHGGRRDNHMGATALVEIEGRNLLVLNSLRHPPFSLGQLTCLGIQPQLMKLLVVKAAIAYKAAYLPVAGSIIEVDTPGSTAVNPKRFAYRHLRPIVPLAEVSF